jgi:hypothetical protein
MQHMDKLYSISGKFVGCDMLHDILDALRLWIPILS